MPKITYLDEQQPPVRNKITYLDDNAPAVVPEVVDKPNLLGQLKQSFQDTGVGLIRGVTEPILKTIGSAGLGIESLISRKPPLSYDVQLPQSLGGKVQIRPMSGLKEAVGLGLRTSALGLAPTTGGAMYGAGQALEEGKTALDVAGGAIAGGTLGKAAGMFMGGEKLLTGRASKLPKAIKEFTNKNISTVRDYPANKVNSIRQSFWNEYAPKEWKAYGEAIDNLPNQPINGADFLNNVEQVLIKRNILNPDGTFNKALNPADNKLLRSYESMYRKFANSSDGTLQAKDIVNEYQSLKGKFSNKTSNTQRQNLEVANQFFSSASDQIKSNSFKEANKRYKEFKSIQELIDLRIDLYGSQLKTAKGENYLTGGALSSTREGRLLGKTIESKTGQGLKGARLLTGLSSVNPLNWVRIRR